MHERSELHDRITLPVVEEQVQIEKRWVEDGRVRVQTRVVSHEALVQELLREEAVNIERVSINREVTEVPQVRTEGSTVVIPIVEEVLVVEKRLVLREEVRVTRTQTDQPYEQQVTLRREEVVIERTPTVSSADGVGRAPVDEMQNSEISG